MFFSKRNTTDFGKFNSAHRTRQDIFQRGTEIQSKINRVTYSLRIHAHQRQANGKIILFVTELGHTRSGGNHGTLFSHRNSLNNISIVQI